MTTLTVLCCGAWRRGTSDTPGVESWVTGTVSLVYPVVAWPHVNTPPVSMLPTPTLPPRWFWRCTPSCGGSYTRHCCARGPRSSRWARHNKNNVSPTLSILPLVCIEWWQLYTSLPCSRGKKLKVGQLVSGKRANEGYVGIAVAATRRPVGHGAHTRRICCGG